MLGEVLEEAKKIILGERQDDYGNPEDCFSDIAMLWQAYIDIKETKKGSEKLKGSDVAFLMGLLKLVREIHSHKRDNLVDYAGYIDIGNKLREGEG